MLHFNLIMPSTSVLLRILDSLIPCRPGRPRPEPSINRARKNYIAAGRTRGESSSHAVPVRRYLFCCSYVTVLVFLLIHLFCCSYVCHGVGVSVDTRVLLLVCHGVGVFVDTRVLL